MTSYIRNINNGTLVNDSTWEIGPPENMLLNLMAQMIHNDLPSNVRDFFDTSFSVSMWVKILAFHSGSSQYFFSVKQGHTIHKHYI